MAQVRWPIPPPPPVDSRGGAFDVMRGGNGLIELLGLGGLTMQANEGSIELEDVVGDGNDKDCCRKSKENARK